MKKIIVIIGTTASYKTHLAIEIAKKFNGEIINADAFQVYNELNIGTSRASEEEKKQAKFHLDGEISIYDTWDIKKFQDAGKKLITTIYKNKKVPILVGGSMMYVDALIKNYDLSKSTQRSDKYSNLNNNELYDKLLGLNKEKALEIGKSNTKRLIRALQIIDEHGNFDKKNKMLYEPLYVNCELEREEVYKRINQRVDLMFKNGWINEVKTLYKNDKNIAKLNAFKAIGYNEILNSLLEKREVNIEKIKMETRRYAKRQLTWIRHHYDEKITFNGKNINEIIKKINIFLS